MSVPWLYLVLYALATARATAILTGKDEVTRPYIYGWANKINPDELERGWRHLVSYLMTCQWCASIWIGFPVAWVTIYHGGAPWAFLPALALTYSQVTGMLSNLGRD
jgi:hypothetical protein